MPTFYLHRLLLRRKNQRKTPQDEEESEDESKSVSESVSDLTGTLSIQQAPNLRLELPMDLRSRPFSRACFSAPISELPRLYRLQESRGQSCESFRLLDLPTELRLGILALHFGKRTVSVTFNGKVTRTKRWFSCDSEHRNQNNCAILSACKQMCKEATDVLWDCTTFVVKVGETYPSCEMGADSSRIFSPPRPLELTLGNMRRAIFMIEVCTRQSAVHLVLSELAKGYGLRTAELHFDFGAVSHNTKSPWMEKVNDDEDVDLSIDADYVVRQFLRMKVDCMPEASCVKLQLQSQHSNTRDKWTCVPCDDLEAYKLLLRKFNALDVSEEQCGSLMPCYSIDRIIEVDTRALDIL